MPSIKRRYFFQCAGATVALWGLSQARSIWASDGYGNALAYSRSQSAKKPTGQSLRSEAGSALQGEVPLPRPGEMMLKIGIDESLGEDPLVPELIQRNRRIEVIDLQDSDVDYIIGRATVESQQNSSNRIAANSIGLFLPNLQPIANTFGAANESVPSAINRLRHAFDKLLITQIVRTIATAGTSRPRVRATMLTEGQDVQLVSLGQDFEPSLSASQLIPVPSGSQVSFEIQNQENIPAHLFLLAIDSEQNTILMYPRLSRGSTLYFGSQILPPAEKITVPDASDDFQFQFTGDGDMEIFLVVAIHPLSSGVFYESQALDLFVVERILQDLHRGARAEDLQYAALSFKFSVD